MSLIVEVDQFGKLIYSKKLFVEKEKKFKVPEDLCKTGIVRVLVKNDRNEILGNRSVYYWGEPLSIPAFESLSLSVIDEVFSPAWKSTVSLGEWFSYGPELAYNHIGTNNLDTYLLTDIKSDIHTAASSKNEEGLSFVEIYLSELSQKRFFNNHFLSEELKFPEFYAENKFALDEMGLIPKKLSSDERVRRQLDQGKSVLSVIRSIRAYKLVNNQMVFRGTVDSFNNPGGSIIVIDGIPKGANIQVLQDLSPFDVSSIKISASISDIMKYAGMENTAGVVIIETRKANGETVGKAIGPSKIYSPTLLWDADYRNGKEINLPKRKLQGKTRKSLVVSK